MEVENPPKEEEVVEEVDTNENSVRKCVLLR